MEHITDAHYNFARTGKSQFNIDIEELKYLLQSPQIVSRLPKDLGGGRFARVVKLSKEIGTDAKNGNKATKYISVITDESGNILTATPGKLF